MAEPAQILAVEDEESIREMLIYSLERQGHIVLSAANVPDAKKVLSKTSIDMAIVDWMLPGSSGLEFVRALRKDPSTQKIPVIMLTARTDEEDITAGLDAGADDYVCKPFSPKELNSRINALLRRSRDQLSTNTTLNVGALSLNTETHRVHYQSGSDTTSDKNDATTNELEMGHTEFKLLRFFMENTDRVFTRAQLLDSVWGTDTLIEERTVDVHILRLRKVLKPAGLDKMLETIRGTGYRMRLS